MKFYYLLIIIIIIIIITVKVIVIVKIISCCLQIKNSIYDNNANYYEAIHVEILFTIKKKKNNVKKRHIHICVYYSNSNSNKNQQQTQPTYDAGSRNRTRDILVGGEGSHHCAIPVCISKSHPSSIL